MHAYSHFAHQLVHTMKQMRVCSAICKVCDHVFAPQCARKNDFVESRRTGDLHLNNASLTLSHSIQG